MLCDRFGCEIVLLAYMNNVNKKKKHPQTNPGGRIHKAH